MKQDVMSHKRANKKKITKPAVAGDTEGLLKYQMNRPPFP